MVRTRRRGCRGGRLPGDAQRRGRCQRQRFAAQLVQQGRGTPPADTRLAGPAAAATGAPARRHQPARALRAAGGHGAAPERAAARGRVHEFVVDEATELSGAQRVLLVLDGSDGLHRPPRTVPLGEDARRTAASHHAVAGGGAPQRAPSACVTARTAPPRCDQRSCLIAPLIAQRELLGYLYADIEGAIGRFGDADRDLLAMLGGAGCGGAGPHPRQRGARSQGGRAHRRSCEQRASELAVINSIQQGMAEETRLPGHRRPGRRQAARGAATPATCIIVWWDATTGYGTLPVRVSSAACACRSAARARSWTGR